MPGSRLLSASDFTPRDAARFWSRVSIQEPSACWLWTGALRKKFAHGDFRIQGRTYVTSRIAYVLHHGGPIGSEDIVRHKCDDPRCCNPAHLELGSHADNVADRVARGRSACGGRNGRAKLTEEQALICRDAHLLTQSELARIFGVSRRVVAQIRSGATWRYLSDQHPAHLLQNATLQEQQMAAHSCVLPAAN